MREYAWYSPEYNWIVFQVIIDGCYICFEWHQNDLYNAGALYGTSCDPMLETTWIPLGEV